MTTDKDVIICMPGEGRIYPLGPMKAVFLADDEETASRYSVAEWWVEAHKPGSGPHAHEDKEELFYVIQGVMSFRVNHDWIDAPKGAFLRIPPNTIYDFENRSDELAGVLNIEVPGGFEKATMPMLVAWAEQRQIKGE